MTDLEMTKLCAEAMGFWALFPAEHRYVCGDGTAQFAYDPLHDDAQAMALVKKFRLDIMQTFDIQRRVIRAIPKDGWRVGQFDFGCLVETHNPNLNRAIVECVAKMQKTKKDA